MSNIHVTSGDAYGVSGANDRRLIITVTNAGTAVDLTGVTLTFLVKASRDDTDAAAIITKTTVSGITLATQSGATLGKAYITLAEADTASLEGKYVWELQGTDAVGDITLAAGGFFVTTDLVLA